MGSCLVCVPLKQDAEKACLVVFRSVDALFRLCVQPCSSVSDVSSVSNQTQTGKQPRGQNIISAADLLERASRLGELGVFGRQKELRQVSLPFLRQSYYCNSAI